MIIDFSTIGINFAQSEGGGCKLEPRRAASIRTNGIYKYDPAEGYDGFEGMDVDVDVPQSTLQDNKTVTYTANGSYSVLPDEGYDAIKKSTVTVNVPEKTFRTQEKTATENGDVVPDNGYDGLSKVTVNVPIKNVEASKTVTYTANGDYTISPDSGYDGIAGASVKVNVTSTPTIDLSTGICFAYSKIGAYPYPTTFPYSFTGERADMSYMFYKCSDLPQINPEYMVTSQTTNIKWFFADCLNMKADYDLSSWDTSSVTNMNSVFYNCYKLTSLNLSGWNTESVTDMSSMFQSCESLTSLDLSSFSTKSLLLDPANSGTFNNTGIVNFFISSKWFENPYLTTYNFSTLNKWTGVESIAALVAALPSIADTGQKTLTLSAATKNVLTDAQKTRIEEKGWILS